MALLLLRFALVSAFTVGVTATAMASESDSLASTAYRLRIERPDAYRLAGNRDYAPAPAPRSEPVPAALYADKPFADLIAGAAREAALDPALVHAVVYVESRYNPAARSPKGAIGLMQVLPETAARHGVADPGQSPAANLRAGTRYLSTLMELFGGRLDLVLAAYNAGENAVLRHGQRIPPYLETRLYVPAVLAKYREWQEMPGPVAAGAVNAAAPARSYIEYLPGTRLELQCSTTPAQ